MTDAQTEQLLQITRRWTQAHRNQRLDDWQSLYAWIDSLAVNTLQAGISESDREYAADLFMLGGLAYRRSVEFMDAGRPQREYIADDYEDVCRGDWLSAPGGFK